MSHSSDRGLPPLPSASLLSEGRDATGQAQVEPRSRRQFVEGPQLDTGDFLIRTPLRKFKRLVHTDLVAEDQPTARPFCL